MAKIIKSALFVVAGIALIAFSGGIAGALAPILGGFVTAGLVTSIGISVALAGASAIFAPKSPKIESGAASLIDRLRVNYDPNAPRRIAFGITALGTDCRFKETHGNKSDHLSLIIAHASHRITSIDTIAFDGIPAWTLDQGVLPAYQAGTPVLATVPLGTTSNGRAHGSGTLWTSSATFTGCSYSLITYVADSKLWPNGLPSKITTVGAGCPVYDPRLDGTQGGFGPIRADNQDTWRFYQNNTKSSTAIGRNPALCLLTYILGWRINGHVAWGMGLSLDHVNVDSFIQYSNLCEEQVQAADGSLIQRYTCDLLTDTNQSHENTINIICAGMGTTVLVDLDGVYTLVGGYDDTLAPTLAFTGDDILSGGEWTKSPPVRERHNRITGRFADPAQDYQLNDWGLIEVDPLYDGIPRTSNVDLACVNRAETAQRIGKQMLLREKYSGTYTAVFGPRAFGVSVGTLMTLSLAAHGFNDKLFRVEGYTEGDALQFTLALREESPEVYEWDKDETKALPSSILTDVFDPIDAASVDGLTISARSINGANSVSSTYIDVTWTQTTSRRVVSIEIQSREAGVNDWQPVAERANDSGYLTFASSVNGAAIEVRARYRMSNGIDGAWSNASLASTPISTVNQWDFITDNGSGKKGVDYSTNTRDPATPIGTGGTTVGGLLTTITDLQTNGGAAGSAATAAQTAQAASEQASRDAKSYRDQASAIAADPNSAVSQRVNTLDAQLAGTSPSNLSSRLTGVEQTVSNGSLASASSVQSLVSQLAGIAGSGLKTSIDTVSATFVTKTDALANRTSTIESKSVNGSVNSNPDFDSYPDGAQLPTDYTGWHTENFASTNRTTGISGHPYAVYQTTAVNTEVGFVQTGLHKSRGWFVLEADVRIKGSFVGAGVGFYSGAEGLNLHFGGDPDTNGIIRTTSENDFWVYRWRKLVHANEEDYGANVYAFTSYTGLGSIAAAREIIWDHVACRPATDGEVKGQSASIDATNALARIGTEETTRYGETLALANRSTTLESQFAGTTGSNLLSRIQNSETAYSDGRFAQASSFNTLNAQVNGAGGLSATASSAYSVSVDAQNKLASARITLAAVAGDGRAQFSLSSDGHDGRWELVGDGRINGNLTIDGTLTTGKIADNQITRMFLFSKSGQTFGDGGGYSGGGGGGGGGVGGGGQIQNY